MIVLHDAAKGGQSSVWLFIGLLTLLLTASSVTSDKLNERRILLPYNSGVPTNFTLEALSSNSCYKWSSSRPDIASVKPLDDPSCSRRAVVTVVSQTPKRQSSVVTARDLKTNLQIRCDVEIDVVSRVIIHTTTRQIVYGELPEMIKAVAFNEKNDIFTSIGGIQFDWTISPLDIIRYRTWASSSYASPDFVEFWESKGAKSSYVLMEGVRTGSANIKARILGDAYQNVEPSEITVHVVANLMLIPSNDVFLVRGAKVGFRAEISKQGPRVPLNLPLAQYSLEVTEPAIAYFDEQTNLLEATAEGHTSLVLRDRNVEGEGLSQTSTDIHVMRLSYLSMQVSPGEQNFALRNDTVYVITLTLHDDWHHKLYPSDNLNLTIDFPEKHFTVLESTANGTYYVVRTLKTGTTKLKAQFLGAGSALLDTPLTHLQEVTIYPPITLNPSQMLLPWIPSIAPKYTVYVQALGATGEYNWETGDEGVASVKFNGDKSYRATVYTKGDGEVQISCNDIHNSLMFNAYMKIYIRPIDAIEVLPSIVETHIGGNVILPVAVLGSLSGKDGKKEYFDDCEQVPFEVEIIQKNRVRYQPDTFMPGMGKRSCRSLSFECLASGNSRIWIKYGPNKEIKTSAIIGCYAPLTLVHPTEFAVLSLGSIIDIAFEGGPRPWEMYPDGHFTKAAAANSTLVTLKEMKDRYRYNKDLHVYRTECIDYGETLITLEVGNQPSATLANPASTSATVKISCAKPETLIIRPKLKSTCPQQDLVFTLEKNRDIELDVQVLDAKGQPFYNFSTLYFDWSKDGNGAFQESHGIKEEVNGAKGYASLTRSYQRLSQLTTLRSKVRGRITGYHGAFWGDRFDVRREIELVLVDPPSTEEDNIAILKHPSYKKSITIKKGSGYFSVHHTSKDSISIQLKSNDKVFHVVPQAIGSGTITVSDLCLNYPELAIAYSVVEAIAVKVDLIDKIELGATVEGTFHVLDNRGFKLPSVLHFILDFAIISSNNFLKIGDVKPKDEFASAFAVKADRLGLSKVAIQSQSLKVKTVQSASIEIQIFSPLQIIPSNITLIVGNHFQASFTGGPQTQRNIEFSISDGSLASVASSGLIKALKIGKTKLTGRVLNANNFEYSRAEVEVHVAPLKKVKIWCPVNQIAIGSHMPLYLIGSSELHETPFMFGQAEPALNITWSLSDKKIATIESSFQKFGIVDTVTDPIATRFSATTVGTVTVKVRVEVTVPATSQDTEQISKNVVLTDAVQISVYSAFAPSFSPSFVGTDLLAQGAAMKVLLLSPNAELLLHFNHLDRITYRVLNSSQVRIINNTDLILQAGDQLEHAQLLLYRDVHKTGLIEYFSCAIHVDKVRYLSLEFASTELPLNATDVFPIGSESQLVVNYFDNHGRKFDAVKSNLKWHLSRSDIVTVLSGPLDNTMKIRALREGSVVVHVMDEVNQVGSFYKFNVGPVVEPPPPETLNTSQVVDVIDSCPQQNLSSLTTNADPDVATSVEPKVDTFYYSTTLILGTLLLAIALYFAIRYVASMPFGGKVQEYGAGGGSGGGMMGNGGDMSPNGSFNLLNKSPRRVIDYQQQPSGSNNLNNSLLSPQLNRSSRLSVGTPQASSGTPGTPSSPKVGRPLYSTRQYLQ